MEYLGHLVTEKRMADYSSMLCVQAPKEVCYQCKNCILAVLGVTCQCFQKSLRGDGVLEQLVQQ